MARYIDADALIEVLQTNFNREGAKAYEYAMQEGMTDISIKYSHGQFCFLNAIECVRDTPTADVVPKSEVDKLSHKCDECAGCTQWKCDCANIELEVAREIFEELYKSVASKVPIKFRPIFKDDRDYDAGVIDGKRNALFMVLAEIAELKKKYTESEGKE